MRASSQFRSLGPPNLRKAARRVQLRRGCVVDADMSLPSSPRNPRLGLTASEAARHLGVSISTVRRWSDAGHLKGYRTPGGQRRFSVEQLDDFLDSLRPRGG
jgi:excisionase family DNA binding protein